MKALHIFFKYQFDKTHTILISFIIWLYWTGWITRMNNNQWLIALDLLLNKNQASRNCVCFTALPHQKYFNKDHIFISFVNKERNFLLIPGFSRTMNQIQGLLELGLEFFLPNSKTFQDFQGPWQPRQSVCRVHGIEWLLISELAHLVQYYFPYSIS